MVLNLYLTHRFVIDIFYLPWSRGVGTAVERTCRTATEHWTGALWGNQAQLGGAAGWPWPPIREGKEEKDGD